MTDISMVAELVEQSVACLEPKKEMNLVVYWVGKLAAWMVAYLAAH
jgi:hypothetical protein